MLQLLEYLTSHFVGQHFVPVVRSLFRKEQTLLQLFESCSLSHEELSQQLKYLIKQDIVSINKSGEVVSYSLSKEVLLYYQRTGKYSQYLAQLFNKDEQSIVHFLIQNRTSSIEQVVKAVTTKKSQQDKYRKIFMDLLKNGAIFEDEKAADLQICQNKEEIQKKPEEEPKKKVGNKKQSIQVEQQPIDKNPDSHLFTVSIPRLLQQFRDYLISNHLSQKYGKKTSKQFKALIADKNAVKLDPPLDIYNSTVINKTAKMNLLNAIKVEMIEEYIFNRFGDLSLLIYKTLANKPYIDEKQLIKLTLLEKKHVGQAINNLLKVGLAQFYEVRVDRVATLIYFVDTQRTQKWCIDETSRIILNIHLRLAKTQKEYKKTQSEELLTHLTKLQASLWELDDQLILMGF